ncbi:M48 family metallopeptidase [Adhaeribacter soli]|uniref:M48 family metallopeptidase n=1 Tax=Adhaeribacter soli TaxID=2607655 RepID=A0A5N1IRR4_9BACT|nr:M48 family metallopeptidase [Adhaeribacter soli]KAA9332601.1 M48 family metallopeptidase [Adhaeribacter soli]
MAVFQGLFFDGKTSSGQPVEIKLSPGLLVLTKKYGPEPSEFGWKIARISRNDFNDREQVVLEYASEPREVLEVNDPAFSGALQAAYPHAPFVKLKYSSFVSGNPLPLIGVLVGFIALIAAAYFWLIPKLTDVAAENMPTITEAQIGEALIGAMLKDEAIDSAKTVYAQKFFNHLHGKSENVATITVIDEKQANAFAVPGGNIVIFKPIIALTDNYAELAGLLAHENAHLQHRHSLKLLFRNLSTYFLASLLFGDVNGLMAILIENAENLKELEYNRDLEKEADMSGLELLRARKIDPNGMVNLFSALKDEHGKSAIPEFLSTHPVFDSRIEYLKAEIVKKPYQTQPNDSLEYYFRKLKE